MAGAARQRRPADEVLRLNVGSLDLIRGRGRRAPSGPDQWIGWGAASTDYCAG